MNLWNDISVCNSLCWASAYPVICQAFSNRNEQIYIFALDNILKLHRRKPWSAAMLAAKRSAGVSPEVNLRECISRTPLPSANKAAHSGFETRRRHHQKSKTGVSVAPQKHVCPPKIIKKRKENLEYFKIVYRSRCDFLFNTEVVWLTIISNTCIWGRGILQLNVMHKMSTMNHCNGITIPHQP